MNNPSYDAQGAARNYPVGNHQLWIRQQPEKSRVVVKGREKEKKPIDPPPILQLNILNDSSFIHNPYLFCSCELWQPEEDRAAVNTNPPPQNAEGIEEQLLVGQAVSSLHRLKDLDGAEKGFFVFGDLAVNIIGRFRLRFSLWEYNIINGFATFQKDCFSNVFDVASAKEWDGVKESTALSRAIADQGIKLRLRKESRHPNKRGVAPPSAGPSSSVSTPLRPAGGSYSQDAGANSSEPSAKRQKSFGAESRTGSVSSAGYSYHSPGGQAAPYSAYPPSSSAHVQSGYYSQYPSSYAPTSYAYPSYGAQQHYPMSSAAPYRGQQTQPESTSSYPPPSTYASSAYPYPSYATAGGYSYAQNSNSAASKEGMADPSNPPRLAPLQGYDAKNAQYQQQPGQQSQTQRGSYDWPTQGR